MNGTRLARNVLGGGGEGGVPAHRSVHCTPHAVVAGISYSRIGLPRYKSACLVACEACLRRIRKIKQMVRSRQWCTVHYARCIVGRSLCRLDRGTRGDAPC